MTRIFITNIISCPQIFLCILQPLIQKATILSNTFFHPLISIIIAEINKSIELYVLYSKISWFHHILVRKQLNKELTRRTFEVISVIKCDFVVWDRLVFANKMVFAIFRETATSAKPGGTTDLQKNFQY